MITATNIADETGIDIDVVRYRLSTLRRYNRVIATRIGQAWVYPPDTIEKVKNYTKKGYDNSASSGG